MPLTPAPCFVCLGVSMADALSLSLWQSISENIEAVACTIPITDAGVFNISGSDITSLQLGDLVSVSGGSLTIGTNPLLELIDLDSLTTVVTDFLISGNTSLVSLSLPSLVTVAGPSFRASGCTLLANFSAPLWIPTDGQGILLNGCALSAASVELVLRRCVVAGVTTCTINLSGGTNAGLASLSAQGQADAAALIAAGNTVTLNP